MFSSGGCEAACVHERATAAGFPLGARDHEVRDQESNVFFFSLLLLFFSFLSSFFLSLSLCLCLSASDSFLRLSLTLFLPLALRKVRLHENVVNLLGVCKSPFFAIVSEYLPMGSLDRLLLTLDLEMFDILNLIRGCTAGVAFLHQQNIIHRDIACRNLLVSEEEMKNETERLRSANSDKTITCFVFVFPSRRQRTLTES